MKLKRSLPSQTSLVTQIGFQPQLKKRAYSTHTSNQIPIQKFKTQMKGSYEIQYSKLTLKSIKNNFPVSQLKPYSSFYCTQKVQKSVQNEEHKILSPCTKNRPYGFIFQTPSRKCAKNKTFYQFRTKRKKLRQNATLKARFDRSNLIDDEERMTLQFIKESRKVKRIQQNAFEKLNQMIQDQFPNYFEPNYSHQQQNCKSKTCKQGFYRRRKYLVEQQYEFQQPRMNGGWVKKDKNVKNLKRDIGFCIFSRSQNRILSTQKAEQKISLWKRPEKSVTQKCRNLSITIYKEYMRHSMQQKKNTLIKDLNIKFN